MRSHFLLAAHMFFVRGDSVLLQRRFNTGWEDGKYSVPAGHVDAGETVTQGMIREVREEVGVHLMPQQIRVVHVMNRKSEDERVDFFFVVENWDGEIVNAEPDKCDDLRWFPQTALPSNLIPYVRRGWENYRAGIFYSEFGW